MWFVSLLCLSFVAVACVAAVLSKVFRDNWPQFIGLCLICLGVVSRAAEVLVLQYVPPQLIAYHIGMALFAGGTWYKFRRLALAGMAHEIDRVPPSPPGITMRMVLIAALLLGATAPATSVPGAGA